MAVTLAAAAVRHVSPLAVWNQWDARWYLGIATHGYGWSIHGKSALAFFPLYPLVLHLGSSLGIPGLAFALAVSNLAFLGALFYLYRLVQERWGREAAPRAIWLMATFPTAFFAFAPYSEALFLLCAVGALYHARRGEALCAGLCVAGAVLTRSTGVILLPAAVGALALCRFRRWPAVVAPASWALVAFIVYLAHQGFSLSATLNAQEGWHRALSAPWTGITASISWLLAHGATNVPWAVENLLQLAVTVVFLALTIRAWRDLEASERLYCAGFWLLVLSTSEWRDSYYAPLSSMDRFVLVLFPLFGWLGARLAHSRFGLAVRTSTLVMLGSAAVHLAGGWVG